MVTGAGFLGAFWFMVCEYIGECRRSIRITPIVVYAALSLILLAISGESKVLRFCYYSCRAAFMFWILASWRRSLPAYERPGRAATTWALQEPLRRSRPARNGHGGRGRAVLPRAVHRHNHLGANHAVSGAQLRRERAHDGLRGYDLLVRPAPAEHSLEHVARGGRHPALPPDPPRICSSTPSATS